MMKYRCDRESTYSYVRQGRRCTTPIIYGKIRTFKEAHFVQSDMMLLGQEVEIVVPATHGY